MKKLFALALFSPFMLLAACGDDSGSGGGTATTVTTGPGSSTTGNGPTTTTTSSSNTSSTSVASTGAGGSEPFAITSTAFTEGMMIPEIHECTQGGGEDVSPPFAWTPGPAGTMSYAIVMRDLDFNGFIHWVIWDIPASEVGLPEDVGPGFMVADPAGAKQVNPYFGPCSPNSTNTYEFTLYAIDVATIPGLDENSNNDAAEAAIEGASIGSTTLSGES